MRQWAEPPDAHSRRISLGATLDDARHVLLHCPLHKIDRAVMLRTVRTALHSARLTLEDIGSDTAIVQLLLGSMPVTAAHALSTSQTAHRDILRASSKYLRILFMIPDGSMDTTSHDRGRPLAISRPSEPGSPVYPKQGLAPTILDVLRNSSMPALELKPRAAA